MIEKLLLIKYLKRNDNKLVIDTLNEAISKRKRCKWFNPTF